MRIHDQNVQTAVNNWNNFLDGIVEIIRIAATVHERSVHIPNIEEGRFANIRPATTYSMHPAQK